MDLEVMVDRPVHEVFEYFADLERAREWAGPVIERRKTTDGPVGVGTRFHAVDRFPGRNLEFEVEVVRFEEDRLMAAKITPPMDGSWEARFEPIGGATRVRLHADVSPPGPLKSLTPITRGWMKRAVKKDLDAFKTKLEERSRAH